MDLAIHADELPDHEAVIHPEEHRCLHTGQRVRPDAPAAIDLGEADEPVEVGDGRGLDPARWMKVVRDDAERRQESARNRAVSTFQSTGRAPSLRSRARESGAHDPAPVLSRMAPVQQSFPSEQTLTFRSTAQPTVGGSLIATSVTRRVLTTTRPGPRSRRRRAPTRSTWGCRASDVARSRVS